MPRKKVEIDPIRGERLREIIEKNGLTQRKLAEMIPIAPEHLNSIIKGNKNLTEHLAKEIVQLFPDVRLEWLLHYDIFHNEEERTEQIVINRFSNYDLAEKMIINHGYSCKETADENGRVLIELTAPEGTTRFLKSKEYMALLKSVNDFLEGQLLLMLHMPTDRAKGYW